MNVVLDFPHYIPQCLTNSLKQKKQFKDFNPNGEKRQYLLYALLRSAEMHLLIWREGPRCRSIHVMPHAKTGLAGLTTLRQFDTTRRSENKTIGIAKPSAMCFQLFVAQAHASCLQQIRKATVGPAFSKLFLLCKRSHV
jgi:hypothetical protein